MTIPGWPTIVVEAAFTTDPLDDTPSWTTLTQIEGFKTARGRGFSLDRVEAGHSTVNLKNGDRRYDPTYIAGPYFGQLTAGRRIRISIVWDSVTYEVWDGFADSWPQSIDSDRLAVAQIAATDAFKLLNKNNLEPVSPFIVGDADLGVVGTAIVGGQLRFAVDGELCGDRINRILDLWPFPASMRDVDDGLTLLSRDGTPKTGRRLDPSETALSYSQKIRDSEEGRFHVSGDGKITFWARDHWVGTASQNTSQLTLTDDATGDAGYTDITVDPADERYVRNRFERTEHFRDTPVVAMSRTSIATYGLIPDSREVISRYPADMLAQVAWLLAKYEAPQVRISSVKVEPRSNPDVLWPAVLGLELGDRITVRHTPAGVGDPLVGDYWIEHIEHTVTDALSWETVWQLAPVDTDVY